MLAKRMERMALAAIGKKLVPVRWIMTAATLELLRKVAENPRGGLSVPQVQELDPPVFMGIPIEIGTPSHDDPPVELLTQ